MKMCISCGMPMTRIGDYPLYDISRNYCKYCAHADGTMMTFEEKLHSLTLHFMQEHKMEHDIAKDSASVILRKKPAWRRKS